MTLMNLIPAKALHEDGLRHLMPAEYGGSTLCGQRALSSTQLELRRRPACPECEAEAAHRL